MSDNKKATQDGPDMVSIRLADDFFARFADDSGKINATRIREHVEDLEQQLEQHPVSDDDVSRAVQHMRLNRHIWKAQNPADVRRLLEAAIKEGEG